MRFKILCLFSTVLITLAAVAQLPQTVSGTVYRIDSFPSKFVTARNVDVWLPEGYSAKKTYAVLYMHDGQMLFDSTTTWNKKAWDIDDAAAKLMKHGSVKDFIIVGVWNGGPTRHPDYFPQKPFLSLSKEQQNVVVKELQNSGRTKEVFQPVSDNYLKFLVTELKPFIDKHYATKKDRQNTFIAGSSMGGLISMYAICEYPLVFGGAACLSTHWPGTFSINNEKAKSQHRVQYFETGASRAIYVDGWKAAAYHPSGTSYKTDVWELFNMENDFNEMHDLSKKYPEKLKALRAIFEIEAKKNHVYPLHDSWFPADPYLQISDSRTKEAKQ